MHMHVLTVPFLNGSANRSVLNRMERKEQNGLVSIYTTLRNSSGMVRMVILASGNGV